MRKRLVETGQAGAGKPSGAWLNVETLAEVELSSEDTLFPIEHALGAAGGSNGWRAAVTGPQTIRLLFDAPVAIHRIYVHFVERTAERAQEFAVYSQCRGGELKQVVRQQFSFSPGGSTEEIEDYSVDLQDVSVLEVRIDPDRAHDPAESKAFASLNSLRVG